MGAVGRSFWKERQHPVFPLSDIMITWGIKSLWTQAESIQRREELLQEMESVNQLTARQSKHKEEEQIKRAEELREQVINVQTMYRGFSVDGHVCFVQLVNFYLMYWIYVMQMSERKLRANLAKLQYEREIEAQRLVK